MDTSMSKFAQESHLRIVDKALSSEKLESIFEKGTFEGPAIVLVFERLPSVNFLNMLKNILNIEKLPSELDTFVYIGTSDNNSFVKVGKFHLDLDHLYKLQELSKAQKLSSYEITDDGTKRVLDYRNYVTTMKF